METSNFALFSNCIPVKGFNRSVVCDTQNNKYYFIPNGLYEILDNYNGKTISDIKKGWDNQYDGIIDEYFEFLVTNRLVFFTSKPELFPSINAQWDSPSAITNAIIDYEEIMHDFTGLLAEFEKLKCSYIQLRFFKKISFEYIKEILQLIESTSSRIVSVDIIMPYSETVDSAELNLILAENQRVHSIILFNAPFQKSYDALRHNMGYLMFIKKNIINEKFCGVINDEYFYSNIKLYSESLHHNTCLNRKISIDKEGNIKNCPSMPQSFGNIKETSLTNALSHPDFKKHWNVTKDKIDVCKDCEFRHVCTDCRAYVEDPLNELSKPLKCGYDPYTNVWEDWSTNPLKQKGIEYYGMQNIANNND